MISRGSVSIPLLVLVLLLCNVSPAFSISNTSSNNSAPQLLGDGNAIRWAVIIGVGFNPHQYIYCRRDTRDIYNTLVHNGWEDDHIKVLLEEEATRETILDVFWWLNESGIDEDDILFFYSSTHGYYMDDQPPIDEPDGKDEFIQPFDYDWETDDFCIRDDELAVEFSKLKTQNMAIFIESCHSGGMLDGTSDLCASGRVVITACDVNESGWPLAIRMHWLFPYYVNKALRGHSDHNGDHWISAEETYQYTRFPVMIRSALYTLIHPKVSFQIQHPQIYDGWPTINNNAEDLKLIPLT